MRQKAKSRDGNAKNDAIKYPLRIACERKHVRLESVHWDWNKDAVGEFNVLQVQEM
jgi:hypothetical protein